MAPSTLPPPPCCRIKKEWEILLSPAHFVDFLFVAAQIFCTCFLILCIYLYLDFRICCAFLFVHVDIIVINNSQEPTKSVCPVLYCHVLHWSSEHAQFLLRHSIGAKHVGAWLEVPPLKDSYTASCSVDRWACAETMPKKGKGKQVHASDHVQKSPPKSDALPQVWLPNEVSVNG